MDFNLLATFARKQYPNHTQECFFQICAGSGTPGWGTYGIVEDWGIALGVQSAICPMDHEGSCT